MIKFIWVLLLVPIFGYSLTADEVVKNVDKNMVFNTEKALAVMTIDRDGKKIVKEMNIFGMKDGDKSFVEFINKEDLGVKYLKIGGELWIYFPDADDIMKISGHMLSQGMMGSDISYEDMLNDEKQQEKYNSVMLEETNLDGAICYNIEMTAKTDNVTYYKKQVLVDREKMIMLELNMYAKSGRPLKRMTQTAIKIFGGRYYPTKIIVEDTRRKNSNTVIEFKNLEFDIALSAGIFTKQNLKK